jgi:hypothetical protein
MHRRIKARRSRHPNRSSAPALTRVGRSSRGSTTTTHRRLHSACGYQPPVELVGSEIAFAEMPAQNEPDTSEHPAEATHKVPSWEQAYGNFDVSGFRSVPRNIFEPTHPPSLEDDMKVKTSHEGSWASGAATPARCGFPTGLGGLGEPVKLRQRPIDRMTCARSGVELRA